MFPKQASRSYAKGYRRRLGQLSLVASTRLHVLLVLALLMLDVWTPLGYARAEGSFPQERGVFFHTRRIAVCRLARPTNEEAQWAPEVGLRELAPSCTRMATATEVAAPHSHRYRRRTPQKVGARNLPRVPIPLRPDGFSAPTTKIRDESAMGTRALPLRATVHGQSSATQP